MLPEQDSVDDVADLVGASERTKPVTEVVIADRRWQGRRYRRRR
jgi:hypothetical protein